MAMTPTKTPVKPVTPDELKELSDWWQEHGNLVSTVLLVVAVAFVGVRYWRSHVAAKAQQASAAAAAAASLEDMEQVAEQFPSAPTAPGMILRIAAVLCNDGNYDAAADRYTDFLSKYADHELAPVARLGLAFTDEARGKFDEALRGYEDFLAGTPGYLEPVALLGKSRVLAFLKRTEEATTILDSLTAKKPNTAWASGAEDLKTALPHLVFTKPEAFGAKLGAQLDALQGASDAAQPAEETPAAEAPASESPAAAEPPAAEPESTPKPEPSETVDTKPAATEDARP